MRDRTDEGVSRSVARNLLALFTSRVAVGTLSFVSLALLAAYLGPAKLGTYTFALAFASLFLFISEFGFAPVVTRDIAQSPEREREIIPNVVYLRLGLGALAYSLLLATLVVAGYPTETQKAALVAGVLLVVVAFQSFGSCLAVRMRQSSVALGGLVDSTLRVVGVLVLIKLKAGVIAFLWLYIGTTALGTVVFLSVALRTVRFDWRPRPRVLVPIAKAAVPLAVATLLIGLYFRMDMAILARVKPAGDLGQYGAAYKLFESFLVFPAILVSVISPVIARSVTEGAEAINRRYQRIAHATAVPSLLVAVVGTVTAWRIVPMLPGLHEFHGAGVALAILSPGAGLITVNSVVQNVLIAGHRQATLLRISAVGVFINLVLNLAFIPRFSYVGAASATTLTEVYVLFASTRAVRRLVGARWPVHRLPRLFLAGLVLAAALFVAHPLPALLQLGLGTLAFGATLFPLGVLTWEDLRGLLRNDGSVAILVGTRERSDYEEGARAAARWAQTRPVRLMVPARADAIDVLCGADDVQVQAWRGGAFAAWRIIRRASVCDLRFQALTGGFWLPLAARLAGCDLVWVTEPSTPRAAPVVGRFSLFCRNLVWPVLVDRISVATEDDRQHLASLLPRLADRSVVGAEEVEAS